MNKENLTKLFKFLKSKKKLPITLDMSIWHETDPTCGTVGCLLGLSHYVVQPNPNVNKSFSLTWSEYGANVFDLRHWSDMWNFLFGSSWGDNQKTNTKVHAIKRIEYVLKHNATPEDWNYDWGTNGTH